MIGVDGSAEQCLWSNGNAWNPVWSPDGRNIVFFSDKAGAGNDHVYVIRADGTGSDS